LIFTHAKAIINGKEGDWVYRTANDYYKEKYGAKVYKLSLDGGFTCPNRDGRVSIGGCIFCSALGGGEFAEHGTNIPEQLERPRQG
jgi:radical SAM superfamily enzyme